MTLILAWLAKHWRVLAYAVALLAAAWMVALVIHWKHNSDALQGVEAALVNEQGCGKGSQCAERVKALELKTAQETATVVEDLTNEIRAISNRPAKSVRLRCTASPGDVRDAGPAPGADAGTAAGGVVSEPAGRDIDVAALYDLARQADEQVALRRALIQWNRALTR